ncbi:hypothetical protein [Nostocoides sp. Soil756]|jgi:hypothetical protein|nr:hypothetical protein [Tetrasphaera sp. Soil756]
MDRVAAALDDLEHRGGAAPAVSTGAAQATSPAADVGRLGSPWPG